ncbi:hypothetical protein BFW88_14850 [Pseudomonas fluorescens]|nr:hypothetical protein BFW88_14850 [Pseudomonas fluorescens]OPB09501.1 hypothetical protein BFW92_15040 [Pseudomonas fluorescens]OPB21346.1 hypothetical protein BFW93_14825 [Pseudomonas fluorescens]
MVCGPALRRSLHDCLLLLLLLLLLWLLILISGTPSLSEVPSVGAKAFWLLLCLYKSDTP